MHVKTADPCGLHDRLKPAFVDLFVDLSVGRVPGIGATVPISKNPGDFDVGWRRFLAGGGKRTRVMRVNDSDLTSP